MGATERLDFWELDEIADKLALLARADDDEDAGRLATVLASMTALLRGGGTIAADGQRVTVTAA